ELDLKGLSIVVDCAHGAAYHVAPPVFRELGADVIAVADQPDGININAGVGATVPAHLAEQVLAHGADLGIALDGDGDRLIMVDRDGRVYDGDELLYIIARNYQQRGVALGGVVGTQMSNLGFEQALARNGIALERTKVGDRYVLERMVQNGWRLGGENSGHIICLDKHTTGDAIVAALAVLRALIERKVTLSAATESLSLFPQHLINVPLRRGADWRADGEVASAEHDTISALGSSGRVLLRASGTEPVLRVMVEAQDAVLAQHHAQLLAATIARIAGQRL
ncbi:MAG: phosphoglucosamine mutase, partial [Casimicrobiaceae bacterium]